MGEAQSGSRPIAKSANVYAFAILLGTKLDGRVQGVRIVFKLDEPIGIVED
jgi:hypothetical protein